MGNPGDTGWLILLYMLADDDEMYAAALADIEEMQRVLTRAGSATYAYTKITVVAHMQRPEGRAQRFKLERGVKQAHDYVPEETRAFQFAKDVIGAAKYVDTFRLLVIWGHAIGLATSIEGAGQILAVRPLFGHINEPVMGPVKEPARLDVLGFDCCHMSTAEAMTFLRLAHNDSIRLVLAPQATIGRAGWRYDHLLEALLHHSGGKQAALPALALGEHVVEHVGSGPGAARSMSMLDVQHVLEGATKAPRLVPLLKDLVVSLEKAVSDPGSRYWVIDAFLRAAWSHVRQFIDLVDLCRHLAYRTPDVEVRTRAGHLLAFLTAGAAVASVPRTALIVRTRCSTPVALGGLSIYCPWPRATLTEQAEGHRNVEVDETAYRAGAINRVTGWGDLMFRPDLMLYAERRMMREYVDARLDEYGLGHDRRALGGPAAPLAGGEPKAGDKDAAFGSFPDPPPPPPGFMVRGYRR